jgi:hypothetical protein
MRIGSPLSIIKMQIGALALSGSYLTRDRF